MEKNKTGKSNESNQAGDITDNKEANAGSGAFNQGSEQDPDYDNGIQVCDEEKETGHTPVPGNKTENPEDDRMGK